MQDEINEKTIAISIKATKLTVASTSHHEKIACTGEKVGLGAVR